MLQPLPASAFEFKRRTSLKVAPNSFVTFGSDRVSYSVPYRLIGHQVDVTFTASQVRIYHAGQCVATYVRSYVKGGYVYVSDHLHPKSREYRAYSAEYFIAKAAKVSPEFKAIIEALFADCQPEQVHFRTAQGFFSLQKTSAPAMFREACSVAVSNGSLRYRFVKALVDNGCQGLRQNPDELVPPSIHSNIRGKSAFA